MAARKPAGNDHRAPNNLRAPMTSFIGRERELAELERLLQRNRLLTLTGAGGAGKSRLAQELARASMARFPLGVWLVDLAPLTDPDLVAPAVLQSLRVKEARRRSPLDAIVARIGGGRTLLVVDNCEHLLEATAALVVALLEECHQLRIVATSREPLGLPGESTWRAPSLELPDLARRPEPEAVLRSPAVRLFADRGSLVRTGFRATAQNALTLAQICRRLDGMPLAIELAAASLQLFTPEELLKRLDDRFELLAGTRRGALPRHRTLRATVDWSYQLLDPAEATLFRRLSVFTNGFTVDAAEAVCAGAPVERHEIAHLLSRLVDKSLVVAEEVAAGEMRLKMLDTLRQYSQERLVESGEGEALRQRHAQHFRRFAEESDVRTAGREVSAWVDRLQRDLDNLRASLDWLLAHEPTGAQEMAAHLQRFWKASGHEGEGRGRLEAALAAAPARSSGRWLALYRMTDEDRRNHDAAGAKRHAAEAYEIATEFGEPRMLVLSRLALGAAHMLVGEVEEARAQLHAACELAEGHGERRLLAQALTEISLFAYEVGDLAPARSYSERSLEIIHGLGDELAEAAILENLGWIATDEGNHDEARQHLLASLNLALRFPSGKDVPNAIQGLSRLAAATRQPRLALQLGAAAIAMLEDVGSPRMAPFHGKFEESMQAARALLGEPAAEAAWAEGRRMAPAQAIRLAQPARGETDGDGSPLTAREREVAVLVADGLTNKEIATALRISERTVDAHVEHMLNKLGYRSRAEVAAWTERHGLTTRASV